MSAPVTLSVVVAVQYAQANLAQVLEALAPARYPQVQFLFCYTRADAAVPARIAGFANAVALESPAGSLIPHLWRDGIRAARADSVAITTAHVIPAADWVERLLEADLSVYPAIGGLIGNAPDSGSMDWAIYFLRYISFAPPKEEMTVTEIAADNAVYRRADLLRYPDLLAIGFWEPSFHARFRDRGLQLLLTPRLTVIHHNRYPGRRFFLQRYAHGRAFGLARATQLSRSKRWLLVLLSPVLPLVFLRKIVTAIVKQGAYRDRLFGASPWLLFFLTGWGLGEARGYLDSLRGTAARPADG